MSRQALTRSVPLRSSALFDNYATVQPLRVGYGQIKLIPIQYDKGRQFWFLLDHACSVQSVTLNDDDYQNYELHNQSDSQGRTISLLETGDAIQDSDTLIVTVNGKTDPDTGLLIENPAYVLHDLLTEVVGYTVEKSRLLEFAAECDAQTHPIKIAGLIDNHQPALRSTIVEILQSVGAMWSLSLDRIARLYPGSIDANERIWGYFQGEPNVSGVLDARNVSSRYEDSEIFTTGQINYDYDWANETYQASVTLQADDRAIEEYGERPITIDARWLNKGALADQLGERLLPYLARPKWKTRFAAGFGGVVSADQIPVGAAINMQHPMAPINGDIIVQSKRVQRASKATVLEIEAAAGREPSVTIVQRSEQFAPGRQEFFFQRQADTAIIQTNPGATVELNGRPVVADVNGRAFFTNTPPGTYELRITLTGYEEIHMPAVEIP